MNISLEEVKTYCRIDGTTEDDLLRSLLQAAKDYLTGAGIKEPDDSARYRLAALALVLHYYDYRGLTEAPMPTAIPGIRNLINQLKLEAEGERVVARELQTEPGL